MIKKIILVTLPLLLCACSSEETHKTYNSLKNISEDNYHLVYKDVTESKNSPYEITIASFENKYYYSDGINTIIQKNGKKYTLNNELLMYNSEDVTEYEDYSYGIFSLPKEELKKYESGKTKLYGEKLVYEQFEYNNNDIKYYYKNNDLKYIKIKGLNNKTFKIIKLNNKIEEKRFELPENYSVITY